MNANMIIVAILVLRLFTLHFTERGGVHLIIIENIGCPQKVLQLEKSPKFYFKADDQIFLFWQVHL